MTTGLSYDGSVAGTTSYVTQISTMAVVSPSDTNFVNILPQCITYAENRIYRDLDFLFTFVANTSYSLTVGSRVISVPAGTFVVPSQINVITPAGVTSPDNGVRNPLLPVTREYLDAVYGNASYKSQPKFFCLFGDPTAATGGTNAVGVYNFLVGPYPDSAYQVEITGTIRPSSLSSSNLTTFISLYLPDLFIMASMIYIAAYQRNFSSTMGNDPQMPISYEQQYQALLKGATTEEYRKKFEAAAWSDKSPSVVATPTRG